VKSAQRLSATLSMRAERARANYRYLIGQHFGYQIDANQFSEVAILGKNLPSVCLPDYQRVGPIYERECKFWRKATTVSSVRCRRLLPDDRMAGRGVEEHLREAGFVKSSLMPPFAGTTLQGLGALLLGAILLFILNRFPGSYLLLRDTSRS
jgi:hypothetical protein